MDLHISKSKVNGGFCSEGRWVCVDKWVAAIDDVENIFLRIEK